MTHPTPHHPATALIAEDEPLLAQALQAELARAWPALRIVASVGDGASAVARTLALRPDILFFDIRMPGMGGIEAATELADTWPPEQAFPALVFVTAYDQYALQAFDTHAIDYILKPVQAARLQKTIDKIQRSLAPNSPYGGTAPLHSTLQHTVDQLRALLPPTAQPTVPPLRTLQASVGEHIHMVRVQDIVYLEAADKYLRVLTPQHEYLLRTPLKELQTQLDPHDFWQIHRSTIVRADAIARVQRDDTGKLRISLHGRPEQLTVSRLYAHLFKSM